MSTREDFNSVSLDELDNDNDNLKNDSLLGNEGQTGISGASNGQSGHGGIFPLARIKKIMKTDKDINLVSADAVNLVSVATELFLDSFVKKASDISQNEKRRTILYKDFGTLIN